MLDFCHKDSHVDFASSNQTLFLWGEAIAATLLDQVLFEISQSDACCIYLFFHFILTIVSFMPPFAAVGLGVGLNIYMTYRCDEFRPCSFQNHSPYGQSE